MLVRCRCRAAGSELQQEVIFPTYVSREASNLGRTHPHPCPSHRPRTTDLESAFDDFPRWDGSRRVVCTPQFPQFRLFNVIERPDPTVGRVRGLQTWGRGPSRRARRTSAVVIRPCATCASLSSVIRTRSIGWNSSGDSRALCNWGKILEMHDVGTDPTGWKVCGERCYVR